MRPHIRSSLRRSTLWMIAVLAVAVASCAPPTGNPEVGDKHAIGLEKKVFSLALHLSPNGMIFARDYQRIQGFVRAYVRRADSRLVISSPPPSANAPLVAEAGMVNVRDLLAAEGVDPDSILLRPGIAAVAEADALVLSFRGYEVKVPECGDWSGETGFNPSNMPHTNHGCSYQRNLGLMLSDPGDLVRSGALDPFDAQRSDTVIHGYKAGADEEAEASTEATPAATTTE